jgi:hypothetical protein
MSDYQAEQGERSRGVAHAKILDLLKGSGLDGASMPKIDALLEQLAGLKASPAQDADDESGKISVEAGAAILARCLPELSPEDFAGLAQRVRASVDPSISSTSDTAEALVASPATAARLAASRRAAEGTMASDAAAEKALRGTLPRGCLDPRARRRPADAPAQRNGVRRRW